MDTLTHALLGATVAQAAAPRASRLSMRERVALGAAAGAWPDLDFVGFWIDPLRYLADWHQGPTHSIVLLPVWAALLGMVAARLLQRPVATREAVVLAALALLSHLAADVLTAYGMAWLAPLSAQRIGSGTVFVVDPLYSAIVVAALVASLRAARWRRPVAGAGLLLLGVYVGWLAGLQHRAVDAGRQAWLGVSAASAELQPVALAQPLSPWHWKLLVADGSAIHEAHLRLKSPLGDMTWLQGLPALPGLARLQAMAAAYQPPARLAWTRHDRRAEPGAWAPLADAVWVRDDFDAFRRFAVHPALWRLDGDPDGAACVWFSERRFDLPALPATFRYGACRDAADAPWRLHRQRYLRDDARQPL